MNIFDNISYIAQWYFDIKIIDSIFYIAILVMSIVIHEVAHGFMAERFGDKTARYAGRLTLNPIKHLDLFGSILLPAILVLTHSPFLFGWAKPVPYNPDNLSNKKWGTIAVASAGVLANFAIAIVFGLIIRNGAELNLPVNFYVVTSIIVLVNLALGVFNLVPVPPLDGSKILFSFFPYSWRPAVNFLEKYSLVFLVLFIYFLSAKLGIVMGFLFHLLTGLAF